MGKPKVSYSLKAERPSITPEELMWRSILRLKLVMVSMASWNFLNSSMVSCISGVGRKVEPTLLAVASICLSRSITSGVKES